MPDYLTQVEEQLVALTEQGRHRRRRRGVDAALLAVPVAIVAAVVVAVAGIGGATHGSPAPARHAPARHGQNLRQPAIIQVPAITAPANTKTAAGSAAPSPPAGGPVPPGFSPVSFTATGEYTWWLLGPAPCSSPPCTSIVRTTDGGRTFVGIPAPRTDGVSELRFANSLDGYAYGRELWVTHDGGASWLKLQPSGAVTELFASDGSVYAIVRVNRGRASVLERSPVQADRWTVLPQAGDGPAGLWAQGSELLLDVRGSGLLASHDRGDTFTRYQAPSDLGCQFESPAPPVVWVHCSTGLLSSTWRSADGGQSPIPTAQPQLPNSAAFAAASATTAVVGFRQLYRTTDSGAHWAPVAGPTGISSWQYLGFTNPTHGVALGYAGSDIPSHERMYYTTDGGASYHR